jgi:MFS transporter, FSR family, fosmidomycin resistance protein
MNGRAIFLLSLGHFLIDFCQGVVPALVPFLVEGRHFSYTVAASLVFAISATSSVVQPLFGHLADRVALSWLLPGSILLAGGSLALGAQAASVAVVLAAFGLCGLGVAAFHPEAARKAHLASGARRTTGMSLFSVGGGLGFALAPAVTRAVVDTWGTAGLLYLLAPTGVITSLLAQTIGPAPAPSHAHQGRRPTLKDPDNWRAFGILSGATICRSIVFYGLNTFLGLYFMARWHETARQGSRAPVVFLGTSIVGTLLGGWLADRFGRRAVIRTGFAGAAVFLAMFLQIHDRTWATAFLIPLSVFLFLPSSVVVVLGQEYLPHRVGMASGVTLGLAVSVGGMTAPLLGLWAEWQGFGVVFAALWVVLLLATAQAFVLPPIGRGGHVGSEIEESRLTADRSGSDDHSFQGTLVPSLPFPGDPNHGDRCSADQRLGIDGCDSAQFNDRDSAGSTGPGDSGGSRRPGAASGRLE